MLNHYLSQLYMQNLKCVSLNNEPCLGRPTLIYLDLRKLNCYPFIIILDKCSGSFNALDDFSDR